MPTDTSNNMHEFIGRTPVPGLEHLGRAITDIHGVPSGSPANYEHTRGTALPLGRVERFAAQSDAQAIIAKIAEEWVDTEQTAAIVTIDSLTKIPDGGTPIA